MAKLDFVARPVLSTDLEEYDRFTRSHGCLFDSVHWTGLFEPSIRRLGIYDAGGDLRGGFCLWEERRFGLRVLRNPPFTRQVGPFFESRATNPSARTTEERAVVEAMTAYLDNIGAAVISLGLSFGIKDCLPFYWCGYKAIPRYTYRIDLGQDESDIFASMSMQLRNHIRKATKDGVIAEQSAGTGELRSLVDKTFARQRKKFPREHMLQILEQYPPGENSYCYVSRRSGLPIAAVYVVFDSHTAFNLMTGYDDEHAHHGAGPLAMWHAILRAKELGLQVFDFEGSVIPPIERYFRGFGGELTPIFSVHKAWLPLEMGLKLIKRQLF